MVGSSQAMLLAQHIIYGPNLLSGDAASDDTNSIGSWTTGVNPSLITIEDVIVKTGSYSINCSFTDTDSCAGFNIDNIGMLVGKKYAFEFWYKLTGTINNFRIGFDDDNSCEYNMSKNLVTTSSVCDWTKVNGVITSEKYFIVRNTAIATCNCYIDGFSIRQVY